MAEVRFDLSKYKNCRMEDGTVIGSFTLKETTGDDEEIAANMAKARGGSITGTEELIRLSIIEVNGAPVKHPYLAFDKWNSRARGFAINAWQSLNTARGEEVESFLASAVAVGSQPPPDGSK